MTTATAVSSVLSYCRGNTQIRNRYKLPDYSIRTITPPFRAR